MESTKDVGIFIDRTYHQYKSLADILFILRKALGTASLEKFNELFKVYQKQVENCRSCDDRLREELFKYSGRNLHPNMSGKLNELKEIQGEVADITRSSLNQAKDIKSALASEIKSINLGRSALKGYKSNPAHHGKIVSKSS